MPILISLQHPIVIVSAGAVLWTCVENLTMTQSAHVREINPSNFQRMHKNQYPIVICYNGCDHYAPTRSFDPQNYYRWKMEKQLGPILLARLLVIEEVDRSKLPSYVLQQVNQVEASIVQALPIISPHSNAAHLRRIVSDEPQRGPVFPSTLLIKFLALTLLLTCLLLPHLHNLCPSLPWQIILKYKIMVKQKGNQRKEAM